MAHTEVDDLVTEFRNLEKTVKVLFRSMVRRAPDERDQAFIIATLALMYLQTIAHDPEFHDQTLLKILQVIAGTPSAQRNELADLVSDKLH